MSDTDPLRGVEACLFDVFGTVVDWHGSVTAELVSRTEGQDIPEADLSSFAKAWRQGYYETTRRVAAGGEGPGNVDVLHRQILDKLLGDPRWPQLAPLWDEAQRTDLNLAWHRLNGWPDTTEGLYALKKKVIISTLSNGNVKLQVDMAKHADLPWDMIFSGELLGSYKPNPIMYLDAAKYLSLPTSKCAMVAAHIQDLRAAASHGMKTVYVRRPGEDADDARATVKSKADGGEVDAVVSSFVELAGLFKDRN